MYPAHSVCRWPAAHGVWAAKNLVVVIHGFSDTFCSLGRRMPVALGRSSRGFRGPIGRPRQPARRPMPVVWCPTFSAVRQRQGSTAIRSCLPCCAFLECACTCPTATPAPHCCPTHAVVF